MQNWSIRRAEAADADGLSDCMDAAYAPFAARIPDLPAMAAGIAEEIANCQVWVAQSGENIVGGLVLMPGDGFMKLANVAVHPDAQGTGLGRALMALAESEAANQGYDQMRLTTHADMPENIRLYTHLGWRAGERRGNKVSMTKAVGNANN